jgi:hypothetical protein
MPLPPGLDSVSCFSWRVRVVYGQTGNGLSQCARDSTFRTIECYEIQYQRLRSVHRIVSGLVRALPACLYVFCMPQTAGEPVKFATRRAITVFFLKGKDEQMVLAC